MTIKEIVVSCLTTNRGKTIGIACGLIFGILILTLGFFKGLFICLCIAAGYWIGSFYDRKDNFLVFLDKILPNGYKK